MIRRVTIRDLRGIRQGVLEDVVVLNVLVGPNGSGKSTILDAILIGAHPVPQDAVGRAVRRRSGVPGAWRWLLHKGSRDARSVITVRTEEAARTTWVESGEPSTQLAGELTESGHAGPHGALRLRMSPDELGPEKSPSTVLGAVTLAHGDNHYAYYPTELEPLIAHVRLIDSSLAFAGRPVANLYTRLLEQGLLDEASALLADVVGVRTNGETTRPPELKLGVDDANEAIVYVTHEGGAVPLGLEGEGIKLVMRTCMELRLLRDGALALMEEPEAFLHPAAIRRIAHAIADSSQRGVQIIVATHSLEMLDWLLSASEERLDTVAVYRTLLEPSGELQVTRYSGHEAAEARTMMADDLR